MKKIIAIILTVLIVGSMSTCYISANDISIDGYEFDIRAINDSCKCEDGMILTSAEALANSHSNYSALIHCAKVNNSLYVAKTDAIKLLV